MDKLKEQLVGYTVDGSLEGLQKASEEWAVDSLRSYTGNLLEKALSISLAIVDFLKELEDESK